MNYEKSQHQLPAPCIIDSGTVVNKEDLRRLLHNLGHVRYVHTIDGRLQSEGEGWIMEVFADPQEATLVANHSLYINVQSFDYLKLNRSPEQETYFDLIQDNRQLRLIPFSDPLQDDGFSRYLDADTLEAILSAKRDVKLDNDDCPF